MDFMLLEYIQQNLPSFLRDLTTKHTLRVFWKSKEQHMKTILKGKDRTVELFYDEIPTITQDEFSYLLEFIQHVVEVDFSFINFDPTIFFQNKYFLSTVYIKGLDNKFITQENLGDWFTSYLIKNLQILDISNSKNLSENFINLLSQQTTIK